jgi:hypothetical protein
MFGVGNIGRIGRADYSAARGGLPLPIFDQLGITAAAAYSLRQLSSAASLACRERRSSDNAEANIGFATAVQTRTNLAAIPINNASGTTAPGVTMTVTGTGTEFGQPYVEVRWQGTASAASFLQFNHSADGAFNPTIHAPVTPGLTYTTSIGFRLVSVSGTAPSGALFIRGKPCNNAGSFIGATGVSLGPVTSTLQRGAAIQVAPANTAFIQPNIYMSVNNGEVVDATIRFYAANVEQGIGNARPLVQRNVPETVAEIGDIDAEALLAHVGAGSGFVTTLYDQSGNARNARQTPPDEQPRIVSNGAIETQNGRPVVRFDGTDILNTPSFILGNTVTTVARRSATNQPVVEGANVGAQDRGLWGLRSGSSDFTTHLNYGINGGPLNATNADGFPISALQIVSQTVAKGAVATTASIWGIGGGIGGYVRLNGFFSEMVATSSLLSTTDRQTLERNQGAYYGITVA